MSPVPPPPPAGSVVPSEDWSRDDSFDLDDGDNVQSHRARLTGMFASSSSSSPLRHSRNDDDDDDDFDFDIDDGTDSFPAVETIKNVNLNLNLNVNKTVIGSGPNGVGTITKFVPKSKEGLSKGSIRMKDAAVAKAWEDDLDLDFEDEGDEGVGGDWKSKLASTLNNSSPGRPLPLTLRPATAATASSMPGADVLDGFDDLEEGEEEEEEDKEATLKAGATLKARLPPPRPRTQPAAAATTPTTTAVDLGDDDDFDLPLNLTNLNLASRSRNSGSGTGTGPRSSMASSDWDSGGTKTDWWSENGTPNKRLSETSGTSISDGLSSTKSKGKARDTESGTEAVRNTKVVRKMGAEEEEEDMEEGLVMPSRLFFTTTSKRDLDKLLDRKRKPQFRSTHFGDTTIRPSGGGGAGGVDTGSVEGMEDGLVFEDQGKELTMKRLTMGKKARSNMIGMMTKSHIPIPVRPTTTATPPSNNSSSNKNGSGRHPSHDILGRTGLPSLRERTQSLAGPGSGLGPGHGLRSHSAGNVPVRVSETPPPRLHAAYEPSPSKLVTDHYRSRSGHVPVPSASAGGPLVPSTPSRGLRHQKSHHHLLTSPSPAKPLSKKQSLSSLNPAPAGLHTLVEDNESSTPHRQYPASTSRLTMPTSSSKAKARPPISSVFPMHHHHHPHHSHHSPKAPNMRVKRRDWGDGTELEGIEDLEVKEEEKKSSWSKSRATRVVKEKKSQSVLSPDKRKVATGKEKEKEGGGSWGRKKKRPPLLIKHLGSVDQRKVVGEMTWNPLKLRWEGNETALRDFDNIPISTSARPALITHISSSSPTTGTSASASASVDNGARIVGDMRFDPVQMRWISLSPDEESDPFEGMADDEDDFASGGGGTIRARKLVTVGLSEASESLWSTSRKPSEAVSSVSVLGSSAGESSSHSASEVWTGHGVASDGSLVTPELRTECLMAEERHKKDMRGWVSNGGSWSRSEARREEKRLWDIRYLALKS